MTSATDVITYIGVPLAVLGVLPILYTFVVGILTQRRIHRSLVHHGHRPLTSIRPHDGFMIRSSPMTSLIEVELPRYTIAPLDRDDDDYWKTSPDGIEQTEEHHRLLARAESTLSMVEEGRVKGFLRGGSWRTFNWKKLIVGRKLYRVQYEDELREPSAEMDFAELVHFLLDWGTVPDPSGWEKLRAAGLWTPAGTVLLRKVDDEDGNGKKHVDWVLRTSVPDESDGILSLCIQWSCDMDDLSIVRGKSSLPPGWGRMTQPDLPPPDEKNDRDEHDNAEEKNRPGDNSLARQIRRWKEKTNLPEDTTSFRFNVEDDRIANVYWERAHIEVGATTHLFHLSEMQLGTRWFSCAAAAVIQASAVSGSLWHIDLPLEIVAFSQKETVPCGVMVILSIIDEDNAPHWSNDSQCDRQAQFPNQSMINHQRFQAQRRAEQLEAAMPPEQARMHRMNRETESRQQLHNDMMLQLAARREREERRVRDAIISPKWSNKNVADACLAWLVASNIVDGSLTMYQLAEAILYLMAVDQTTEGPTMEIVRILEQWFDWATAGGMQTQQVHLLQESRIEFCFASILVFVIQQASTTGTGKAGADMLECLRMWRKVRLG